MLGASSLPIISRDAEGYQTLKSAFFDIETWKAKTFETERSLRPAPPAVLLIK
jgi:hypothetical protein